MRSKIIQAVFSSHIFQNRSLISDETMAITEIKMVEIRIITPSCFCLFYIVPKGKVPFHPAPIDNYVMAMPQVTKPLLAGTIKDDIHKMKWYPLRELNPLIDYR